LARSNIKEALTFGWKKLTIVVSLPAPEPEQRAYGSSATKVIRRDLLPLVQDAQQDQGIILRIVIVDQDVWRDDGNARVQA
jgi:hypothetical protein